MVRMSSCHPEGPRSMPGRGVSTAEGQSKPAQASQEALQRAFGDGSTQKGEPGGGPGGAWGRWALPPHEGLLGTARRAVKTELSTMGSVLLLHHAIENDCYACSFLRDFLKLRRRRRRRRNKRKRTRRRRRRRRNICIKC